MEEDNEMRIDVWIKSSAACLPAARLRSCPFPSDVVPRNWKLFLSYQPYWRSYITHGHMWMRE